MRTFTTDCLSSSLPLVYSSTQQLLWMVPMLLHLVVYSSWCTHWRSHKICPVICKHYIMAIFFTFWLRILATVPPDWVKLVLKAISYVTASFCIQFAIPPANCFFVFLLLMKLIKTVHSPQENTSLLFDMLFNNGDRTKCSPIRSLIIRVIK